MNHNDFTPVIELFLMLTSHNDLAVNYSSNRTVPVVMLTILNHNDLAVNYSSPNAKLTI